MAVPLSVRSDKGDPVFTETEFDLEQKNDRKHRTFIGAEL